MVGALPKLPLAHGGTGGALIETALVVGVAAVFLAVWLRSRSVDGEETGEGER